MKKLANLLIKIIESDKRIEINRISLAKHGFLDIKELFLLIDIYNHNEISPISLLAYLKSLYLVAPLTKESCERFMTFLTKKPFSLGISLEDFSSILLPHGEDQYLKEKALLNRNLKGNYGIGGRSIQVLHHEVLKLHEELWKEEYRLFLSIETEIQLLLEEKLWDSKELYYEIDRNKGKLIDFNKIKVFFLKNNLDLKEKDFTLLIKRFSWEEKGLWITRDDFISLFNVKIIKANLKNRVTYPNFLTAQYELLKIKDLAEKHILQQKKNNLFHEPPFELKTKHCYIGNTKKIDLKYEKFIAKFQKTNYF